MSKEIKSVLNGGNRCYRLNENSTDNFSKRGQRDLLCALTQYETYGDGTTQHSGDWCVQMGELVDVCLSMAAAIAAEPDLQIWGQLERLMTPVPSRDIAAAVKVVYKDGGKTQYYSTRDFKVTTSDKSQDRRFERVESWMDGTPKAIVHMLQKQYWDRIQWVSLAYCVREYLYDANNHFVSFENINECFASFDDDWTSAFESLRQAVAASVALARSKFVLEIVVTRKANAAKALEQAVA